jgi:hypothetical protein
MKRIILLVLVALTSTVTAQPAEKPTGGGNIEVLFQPPRLPDPNDPKQDTEVPYIDATVIGAPNVPMDKFILIDKTVKPPIEIKANKMVDFKKGNENVAIAIVMNGWELWIGNDKEVPSLP